MPAAPPSTPTIRYAESTRAVFEELARRRVEALHLYEPLPLVDKFHASRAKERLLRGSNRAGKTLGATVEAARALTGRDPYQKYPAADGRAFVVGRDGKHNGEVVYRKLFRNGPFKIIRDHRSGQWRAWRPWEGDDWDLRRLAKPAPPLIPERLIEEISWTDKRANEPNVVRLTTGWELNFFSSLGRPPQGSDIDLAWFDEEIVHPDWYPELAARLVDRDGLFMWSATPQAGTDQLYDLHLLAEDEEGQESPRVVEFYLRLADNPFITQQAKASLADKFRGDPTQYAVRIEGEFAIISLRIFPQFSEHVHGYRYFPIPPEWTRYMAIDPGHQVAAALMVATPPPGAKAPGDFDCYIYDEVWLAGASADPFGAKVAERTAGQAFEAFLIDGHAGRQTEIGSGRNVEAQYAEAFKKYKLASAQTGSGFAWGFDDVEAGLERLRACLGVGRNGGPRLGYCRDTCPQFERTMKRYHYKKVGTEVTDKPSQKNAHLIDCARYLFAHGCRYRKPRDPRRRPGSALAAMEAKALRKRLKSGHAGGINLGPGR